MNQESKCIRVAIDAPSSNIPLDLPQWKHALYWAPFQKYDFDLSQPMRWPDGCNRAQPLAIDSFENLTPGGFQLLVELEEGGFRCLLPIASPRAVAWFNGDDGKLVLAIGTLGTVTADGEPAVLAIGTGPTATEACHAAWEQALECGDLRGSTRWRHEKRYPEMLEYLGWCSWEQFQTDISATTFIDAVKQIEASPIPARWALLDDGYLHEEARQLLSFAGNDKFRDHWDEIRNLRNPAGIRWLGLWLNFNGYWSGIHPNHELTDLAHHLEKLPGTERKGLPSDTYLMPKEGRPHSRAFYDAMIGDAAAKGFDFIKVDNQAKNVALLQGHGNAAMRSADNAQALEESSAFYTGGLINCMAHNQVCAFNTRVSAVTRCSEDYVLGDAPRAKRHLYNSYANMLWLGWTVWGDHDMFHSSDAVSARMMAVSKALSGGPVYLSDAPADFDETQIRPLCFADGRLLRPLAPAAPLPDSIFIDPYQGGHAFRVAAPLPHDAAAIAIYNLTDPEEPVTGMVDPQDLRDAGALVLPRKASTPPQHETCLLYDWDTRETRILHAARGFYLPTFSDKLFLLVPIRSEWAVIGDPTKFLSPCAVEILEQTRNRLVLQPVEKCELLVWADEADSVTATEGKITRVAENILTIEAHARLPIILGRASG